MTTITLIVALFGCLLLHLFVLTTIAATVPNSDLPFEFNYNKGSTITDDNVLTQSVSSDGQNTFKTNSPQPIKKYKSADKNPKTSYATNQNSNKKQKQGKYITTNSGHEFPGHTSTSYYSTSPTMTDSQWNFFENFSKSAFLRKPKSWNCTWDKNRYLPGLTNMRLVEYI